MSAHPDEAQAPAAAYARFRARQGSPLLAAFADGYGFAFDDYQREACRHVESGSGVLEHAGARTEKAAAKSVAGGKGAAKSSRASGKASKKK